MSETLSVNDYYGIDEDTEIDNDVMLKYNSYASADIEVDPGLEFSIQELEFTDENLKDILLLKAETLPTISFIDETSITLVQIHDSTGNSEPVADIKKCCENFGKLYKAILCESELNF